MKKIVIVSGGTGNDALLRGICELYHNAEIRVLLNAYDDGKSTGLCRRITNTLGVSDIRKNHYRMYSIKNKGNENQFIKSFYNDRFNLEHGNELLVVLSKLSLWSMSWMNEYAERFFNKVDSQITFDDFNIANIIYSEMYNELGYKETNKRMCQMLGIDDFVVLNSFENVALGALTETSLLKDEASIVDFNNENDKIQSLTYSSESPIIINNDAIDVINNADIIVVSTGTFWSSILPTLEYGQLFKVINNSSAKKFWFLNNEEDKDAKGVGSNEFIDIVSKLGLNLKQFTIIENTDACELLRQPNDDYNVVYHSMGNNNGKHDGKKMAMALFMEFYGIANMEFDNVLIDFDNTICSKNNEKDHAITGENLVEISKSKKYIIVSGNDYKTSIYPTLKQYFGDTLYAFQNDVWADASSVLYVMGKQVDVVPTHIIDFDEVKKATKALELQLSIKPVSNNNETTTCLKIKPLTELERNLMCSYLNDYLFDSIGIQGLKAIKAGRTTVDIIKQDNTKKSVFDYKNLSAVKTLYIGDELMDYGNDYEIAKCCTKAIQVEDIHETNLILKLLNRK